MYNIMCDKTCYEHKGCKIVFCNSKKITMTPLSKYQDDQTIIKRKLYKT